jgi:hypothetical protein
MKHNILPTTSRLSDRSADSTSDPHRKNAGSLEQKLLKECRELLARMEYDEQEGFFFWPHIILPQLPDGPAKCGICTTGAIHIARKFGGFVAGYQITSDDPDIL